MDPEETQTQITNQLFPLQDCNVCPYQVLFIAREGLALSYAFILFLLSLLPLKCTS